MIVNTKNEAVKREVARVINIKFFITVIAIVGMVALCILFWNEDGIYQIELEANKNEGYQWIYDIKDDSIVSEQQNYYANGLFVFVFQGVEEGKTDVEFSLMKEGSAAPLEQQVHTLSVNKDNRIMVKKIYKVK